MSIMRSGRYSESSVPMGEPATCRHPDACSGHGRSRVEKDAQSAVASAMSEPTRQLVYSDHQ